MVQRLHSSHFGCSHSGHVRRSSEISVAQNLFTCLVRALSGAYPRLTTLRVSLFHVSEVQIFDTGPVL